MGAFSITLDDRGVGRELQRLDRLRFERVVVKNMTQVFQRGKAPGGTPVDTGELRQSLSEHVGGGETVVGYTKSYAPHVEYGHRTVSGGYVKGQRYLQRNVEKQRPVYQADLKKHLRGGA